MTTLATIQDLATEHNITELLVRSCCNAAQLPIHILDEGGDERAVVDRIDAEAAIARFEGQFKPTIDIDELSSRLKKELTIQTELRVNTQLRGHLADILKASQDGTGKAQRVVETVIEQAENIVGMQRKTNETIHQMIQMQAETDKAVKMLAQNSKDLLAYITMSTKLQQKIDDGTLKAPVKPKLATKSVRRR